MKNTLDSTKSFNVGLGLLKIWMCYEVVLTHLADYAVPEAPILAKLRDYAVPTFMLMTFFFSAQSFAVCKWEWTCKRLFRLALPFVFWSLVSFVVFRLLSPLYPALDAPWQMLGYQLIGGTTRQIGSQMWFMAVLIWLTIFFVALFKLVRPKYIVHALAVVFTISSMVEYSGLNRWIFEGLSYELRNPLGRICSMMPYAAIALFLGLRRGALESISVATRWIIVCVRLGWAVFLFNFKVFVVPDGFFYRGFTMLAMGMAICSVAYFLPLQNLPVRVSRVIAYLSRFSMGVYFVHILVGRVFVEVVGNKIGISGRCFEAANITFILSLGLSMLIGALPWKTAKGLVE